MKSIVFIFLASICILFSCGEEAVKNESLVNFNFPSDCCSPEFNFTIKEDSLGNSGAFVYLPYLFIDLEGNDSYFPQTNDKVTIVESMIFKDQDDLVVFENSNFLPNDPNQGWNGRIDGVVTDGKYTVNLRMKTEDGSTLEAEGVICVLLCMTDDYFDRGLDLSNCVWPSQHDGNGGWDFLIPVNGLFNCF